MTNQDSILQVQYDFVPIDKLEETMARLIWSSCRVFGNQSASTIHILHMQVKPAML